MSIGRSPQPNHSVGADEKNLNAMTSAGFDSVEWDIALAAQNPHAIGVALKSGKQRISQGSKPRRKTAKTGFGKT